jgi:hypothetical protein
MAAFVLSGPPADAADFRSTDAVAVLCDAP